MIIRELRVVSYDLRVVSGELVFTFTLRVASCELRVGFPLYQVSLFFCSKFRFWPKFLMCFFDEFLFLLKDKGLYFGTKIVVECFFYGTLLSVAKVILKFASTDFPFGVGGMI